MADNTTLDAGSGGDTIRTEDKTTHKTPVSLIDVAGTGTESLVTAGSIGMPVEGVAAENAAVVGPPVLVGGRYDSSNRTLGDGDVGAIAIDAAGFVKYTGHTAHGEGDAYTPLGSDAIRVNSALSNYNGVTWDNVRGDATNGLLVNLGANNDVTIADGGNSITVDGTVTANAGTGTFTVSAASLPLPTGAATAANQSTGNSSLSSIASSTANITTCNTGAVTVSTWSAGTLTVDLGANNDVSLNAGTNAIGKLAANSGVDIGDVDVTSISAGSNLIGDVSLQPRATGGLTMSKTTSAASTNATSLKASAGQVYSIQCFNVNAAVRYLKLYNKASAPTVGTDTPVKTLAIPGNTAGAGFVIPWPQGLAFGTGIAFALTTEATDAGTTGVAADEITVNIDYK